ncbi:MAG: aconitate hydratase [Actinomycetia bacterium]|nr:aconitate hydratase [Actinomycetes bacterium]
MVVGELLMYPFHQARRAVQLRGERGSPVDSLQTRDAVPLGGRRWQLHRLDRLGVDHLPFTLKVLLENLLRHEDGQLVTVEQIEAVRRWDPAAERRDEVDLHPTRVFLHDTNGVPALVDLAAMRDALAGLGGDPRAVNPIIPAELVADHSVIADVFGRPDARDRNVELEYARNSERYRFLKWGQATLGKFKIVPPGMGIMHQVNIEYLARVVEVAGDWAYPDVCLGTDSHTTMVNGLGVLGWGSAASRPRPSCWGSRCRWSCRRWWASGSAASCRQGPRPPTWCSPSPSCCAATAWWASSSSSTVPG